MLRMLAETQYESATRFSTRPKAILPNLKFDELRGGRETTTHQYRSWKRQVQITQHLHGLSDPEMALIIYTQVKGRGQQLFEVLK